MRDRLLELTDAARRASAIVAVAFLAFAVMACSSDSDEQGDSGSAALSWPSVSTDWSGGALLSGQVAADGAVWVVGGQPAGDTGGPAVLKYEGGAWSRLDPGLDQQLWWVHVFDSGAAIVVGDRGAAAMFDGKSWTKLDTGVPGTTLYGAWGTSPSDLWVVGGPSQAAPSAEREGDVVLHYDGTAFKRVTIQALVDKPSSAGKNIFKVWGASASEVFIVGDSGLALHFDGTDWQRKDTTITSGPLFTVAGRSASDVYAVGGLLDGIFLHYDGTSWERIDLPLDAPQAIQGVWTAPGQPVVISGWYGFTAQYGADGAWQVVQTDSEMAYHAVFGSEAGIWAAGGDIYAALAEHRGILISTRDGVPALP